MLDWGFDDGDPLTCQTPWTLCFFAAGWLCFLSSSACNSSSTSSTSSYASESKKGATVTEVRGNLLESKEQYIVQQCNCTSTYAKGLSKAIFQKWPYADAYKKRTGESKLGSIDVKGKEGQRLIINLFGQYGPGKPKSSGPDTKQNRANSFRQGLEAIAKLPNLKSLAFPYQIGCGLGGGSWIEYEKMIRNFASQLPSSVKIIIYRLPNE